MELIGDVQGKNVVLVDDMVDTAGTLTKAADLMMERGALSVRAITTHGLLSGNAYERIEKSQLKELIISDSIPIDSKSDKVRVLTCADLFADVMHRSITIKGSERESVGKKATKALRNAGMVPCVVYGGDKPLHFSAPELAFRDLVYTAAAHTVKVDLGEGKLKAIMQDIQFHPVTDRILHIDFYQIFDDIEITMNIPVKLLGSSPGVRNGGLGSLLNDDFNILHPESTVVVQVKTARAAVEVEEDEEEGEEGAEGEAAEGAEATAEGGEN
ncbi:50S ribosomal protein L25 [Nymphon striatum]|nr:50S ribosomal protein L25 [Nymphon striatum]